jgi:thiol:disulfide interchange protein DsbC
MRATTLLLTLAFLAMPLAARAFPAATCGDQTCVDCHTVTREEVKDLLGDLVDEVVEINPGDIHGLWEVVVSKGGQKLPVYLDYSKGFVIGGQVIRLRTRENVTGQRMMALNKVDVSRIPLGDAVVLGNPMARHKIVVFDDPECPYCKQLFPEMQAVVAQRPDIAFFIKMFPLKIHPTAYDKAKAIVCEKSIQMLEDSLAGKALPPPKCQTDQIEKNLALAEELGIGSVPTLVYPDGAVAPGFARAADVVRMLDQAAASVP